MRRAHEHDSQDAVSDVSDMSFCAGLGQTNGILGDQAAETVRNEGNRAGFLGFFVISNRS